MRSLYQTVDEVSDGPLLERHATDQSHEIGGFFFLLFDSLLLLLQRVAILRVHLDNRAVRKQKIQCAGWK
jgi:hypothetical protein